MVVEAAADTRNLQQVAQGLLEISVNELALQVFLLRGSYQLKTLEDHSFGVELGTSKS